MWGKKPDQQQRSAPPAIPESKIATPPKTAPATMEAPKMSTDALRPSASSSSATARLGASLHIKGEITGHEDLLVDGSVEGLIQLEDRKLTVGATAKVTATLSRAKSWSTQRERQFARQRSYRD